MKKLIFLLLLVLFFFSFNSVHAQDVCESATVKVILRDSSGDFIPNMPFEIYEQIENVDGQPAPGKKVASGKIDQYLGYGKVSFKPIISTYAIKTWHKNSSVGEFWFFDELVVGCGEEVEITKSISGIEFIFRDSQGALKKNIKFDIYTQKTDADGNPIKQKNNLIGRLDTVETGIATIYVPQDLYNSKFLTYYILSAPLNGGEFIKYDIDVKEGLTTVINYVFSDILISLVDENDSPLPANTKLGIYKQTEDFLGEYKLGSLIKTLYANDKGVVILEYPAGIYSARLMGNDGQYQYFWDLEIFDQERRTETLIMEESLDSEGTACKEASTFELVARNTLGEFIPNLSFALAEQRSDIDGNYLSGQEVATGKIDKYGKGSVVFYPDPKKSYALKIYGINASVGAFWFFDDIQFACGQGEFAEKELESLNIVIRDGNNNLKKNQKFSLHTQNFDLDGNPIKEKKDLVSADLNTGESGEVILYLSPSNQYIKGCSGEYVLSFTNDQKITYTEYRVSIDEGEANYFEYVTSDMLLNIKYASGQTFNNSVEIFYQGSDAHGNPTVGEKVGKIQIVNGSGRVENTAGNYVLKFIDETSRAYYIWDMAIANQKRSLNDVILNTTKITGKKQ
jgi:hypothetical protein